MVELERRGAVYILIMRSGENRFNRRFLDELNGALDEIEGGSGPAALVTSGEDKFWSNGLDLDWMTGEGSGEGAAFVKDVMRLMARVLGLPVATVAALNGHAFAGGAMLALAHDFRVMRADRGYFCLPEVDIGLPFTPGMSALIRCKLAAGVSRDLMLTGRRIGGEEAAALGVVDETAAADAVLVRAVERAERLATKDRAIYGAIKREMYAPALKLLTDGTMAA